MRIQREGLEAGDLLCESEGENRNAVGVKSGLATS